MSQPKIDCAARLLAAVVASGALGASLAGCSSLYVDRTETISPSAGDAIAANTAEQTVDPWPRDSGNQNIGFNGQRMQAAMQRYRQDKVTDAVDSQAVINAAPVQNTTNVTVGAPPATPGAPSAAASSTAAGDAASQ